MVSFRSFCTFHIFCFSFFTSNSSSSGPRSERHSGRNPPLCRSLPLFHRLSNRPLPPMMRKSEINHVLPTQRPKWQLTRMQFPLQWESWITTQPPITSIPLLRSPLILGRATLIPLWAFSQKSLFLQSMEFPRPIHPLRRRLVHGVVLRACRAILQAVWVQLYEQVSCGWDNGLVFCYTNHFAL